MMGYADFRALVRQMMDLQAYYFKHRERLDESKKLERMVRDELAGKPAQAAPTLFDRPRDVDGEAGEKK